MKTQNKILKVPARTMFKNPRTTSNDHMYIVSHTCLFQKEHLKRTKAKNQQQKNIIGYNVWSCNGSNLTLTVPKTRNCMKTVKCSQPTSGYPREYFFREEIFTLGNISCQHTLSHPIYSSLEKPKLKDNEKLKRHK